MKIRIELLQQVQAVMVSNLEMVEESLGFPKGSRFKTIKPELIDQRVVGNAIREEGYYEVRVYVEPCHIYPEPTRQEILGYRVYPNGKITDEEFLFEVDWHSRRQAAVLVLKPEFFSRYARQTWILKP